VESGKIEILIFSASNKSFGKLFSTLKIFDTLLTTFPLPFDKTMEGGACRVYNADALRDLIYSNLEEAEKQSIVEQESQQHGGLNSSTTTGRASSNSLGRGASRLDGGPSIRSNRSHRSNHSNRSSRASLGGGSGVDGGNSRAQREQARIEMKTKRFRELQRVRDKEDTLAKKERLEEITKKKERVFKYWMKRVDDPKEKAVVNRIQNWLDLNEDESKRKLRAMHNDWEENVYGAISNDILSQMEDRDPLKTKQRIRREYQNYIDLTNKKGQIFRDIFVESEYDPNILNRATIKAKPKDFDDPTDRVLRRRLSENAMMSGGILNLNEESGGRETLEVESWLTGKIESTPHGFAARFGEKPPEVSEMQKRLSRSRVKMDQFHILTGEAGRKKLMAELGPGKKSVPGKRPDHKMW